MSSGLSSEGKAASVTVMSTRSKPVATVRPPLRPLGERWSFFFFTPSPESEHFPVKVMPPMVITSHLSGSVKGESSAEREGASAGRAAGRRARVGVTAAAGTALLPFAKPGCAVVGVVIRRRR